MFMFKVTLPMLLALLMLSGSALSAVTLDHPSQRRTLVDFTPNTSSRIMVGKDKATCLRGIYQKGRTYNYYTVTNSPELKGSNYNGFQFVTRIYDDTVKYVFLMQDDKPVRYLEAQEGKCRGVYSFIGPDRYSISCKATADGVKFSGWAAGDVLWNPFTKVDFKYDSLMHMSIDDAFVDVDVNPEKLVQALSSAFQAQGNRILKREKLDAYPKKDPHAVACQAATHDIARQEFSAYRFNNFNLYKKIDRNKPFTERGVQNGCPIVGMVKDPNVESWFLKVEIPRSTFSGTMSVSDANALFRLGEGGVSAPKEGGADAFASRLYLWAWNEPKTGKTKVYMIAKPVNNQVEACNGCNIGHDWWQDANGYLEFQLVQKYLGLLRELNQSKALRKQVNAGGPAK